MIYLLELHAKCDQIEQYIVSWAALILYSNFMTVQNLIYSVSLKATLYGGYMFFVKGA